MLSVKNPTLAVEDGYNLINWGFIQNDFYALSASDPGTRGG